MIWWEELMDLMDCLIKLIGSLTDEHKASYSIVFSDIEYRQNIAER